MAEFQIEREESGKGGRYVTRLEGAEAEMTWTAAESLDIIDHTYVPPELRGRSVGEALVARDGLSLMQLPEGARVGTSAPRRISQLAALRPDLEIRPLRGNIDTRMSKVTDGELDAVVLAYAGLLRGGYEDRASDIFDPELFMPAPAQGALAIEAVAGTEAASALDAVVDDQATSAALAERAVLARLEAGTYGTCVRCGQPIARGRLEARPEASDCITCARTGAR